MHIHVGGAGSMEGRTEDGSEHGMECVTPLGNPVSVEASLWASSTSAVVDSLEAAPVWEGGC